MRHLFLAVFSVVLGCGNGAAPDRFVVTPVTMRARLVAPGITVVVDRSAGVAPRFDELRQALANTLQRHPTVASYGLAALPGDASCGAGPLLVSAVAARDEDDATLTAHTSDVVTAMSGLSAGGSASIAATLRELPDGDPQREEFVLLVTASDPACGTDAAGEVLALRRRNVKTIVVGFGAEAATSATLETLARGGGFQRNCPGRTAAECGPQGTCLPDGACSRAAWLASDGAELEATLDAVFAAPPATAFNPCLFRLTTSPRSLDRFSVFVDHRRLTPEVEFALGVDRVELLGEACALVRRSSARRPIEVQFWVDVSP